MTNLRLIATAVVGVAVGAAIGYKYAEKKIGTEFEERLERETNLLRRLYKPEYESPEDMVNKLHGDALKVMEEYAGEEREPVAYHKIRPSTVEVEKVEEQVIERNVFEPDDDRGAIYIISVDEHTENEPGFESATWTYYAKDGVVTDIHEERIEDYDKHIGTEFAENFGGRSGDENVVYVRNEVTLMQYEIVRSQGSYVEEVLGEEYKPPIERPSQRMQRGG